MRLFEAIIEANHRASRGEAAGLHPADFADSLPVVALTCIDPRLNPLMPAVLGIPEEKFIWLRNAGNIITGPMSSTMRSLALACAIKGGREIAIIGHSDCRVGQVNTTQLIDRFRAVGVDRSRLPDNVNEFFGMFASESSNVLKAVELTRQSPLIGARIPVHGLLVDISSGRLEWLVNGYSAPRPMERSAHGAPELLALPAFELGEIKFPNTKIGEVVTTAEAPRASTPPKPVELSKSKSKEEPPRPPRLSVPWKKR